jgi:GWxTD domain-containing protein
MITKETRRLKHFGFVVSLLFILTQCASTQQEWVDTGALDTYIPGLPNFTIGAVGKYDSPEAPELEVYISIPYSSLIFQKKDGEVFESLVDVSVWLSSGAEGNGFNRQISAQRTLRVNNYEETQSRKELNISQTISLSPGEYFVHTRVEDRISGKQASRTLEAVIPDPKSASVTTANWQLFGKKAGGEVHEPILTYHISEDVRDMIGSIQVVMLEKIEQHGFKVKLLQFKSDTSIARVPHYVTPIPTSIEYRGIDYTVADTSLIRYRLADEGNGIITIRVQLPALTPGNYRLLVEGRSNSGDAELSKSRDFSVRKSGFPRIERVDELLCALSYIATSADLKRFANAKETGDYRLAFNQFWSSLFDDKQKANYVMQAYFTRIEEANRMFSSHKEGWKSDPGMIYILFGAPHAFENNADGIVWSYSNPRNDASRIFFFRRIRPQVGASPFVHYLLDRSLNYEFAFQQAVEDWRSGRILFR